jgi:hypothetical protein
MDPLLPLEKPPLLVPPPPLELEANPPPWVEPHAATAASDGASTSAIASETLNRMMNPPRTENVPAKPVRNNNYHAAFSWQPRKPV